MALMLQILVAAQQPLAGDLAFRSPSLRSGCALDQALEAEHSGSTTRVAPDSLSELTWSMAQCREKGMALDD